MGNHENHELDIDFELIEDPEDLVFPRMPNVISRRGHRLKIIATVHDVPYPDRTTDITLSSAVYVLNNSLLNEKGHTFQSFQTWGVIRDVKAVYPSPAFPKLPFRIEAIVSKDTGDDHLGQGPDFQAVVEVKTSNSEDGPIELENDGGRSQKVTPSHTATNPNGTYLIKFSSK